MLQGAGTAQVVTSDNAKTTLAAYCSATAATVISAVSSADVGPGNKIKIGDILTLVNSSGTTYSEAVTGVTAANGLIGIATAFPTGAYANYTASAYTASSGAMTYYVGKYRVNTIIM